MGNPFYTGIRKECNLFSAGATVLWQSGERGLKHWEGSGRVEMLRADVTPPHTGDGNDIQ